MFFFSNFKFFIIQFCDVATLAIILDGELAMFGYIPTIKVEIYYNPFLFWLLGWTIL
jgi:hypothetical protein